MNITERLAALRAAMNRIGIDAYLIPSDDDHASEYVNDHFKCREWITGFTGSAGTALVTQEGAWLWTDGRYFLQAEDQLRGSGFTLMKIGEPGVPTIKTFIADLADADKFVLGFDGCTMTAKEGEELEKVCPVMTAKESEKPERDCPVRIAYTRDLIGEIWEDRPALEPSEVWEFPLESCGKSFEEKIADVRAAMNEKGADVLLVSDLMETAWLFNLRGADVQNTPVFYSYTIVTKDKCCLFTLPGAVSEELEEKLESHGVTVMDYHDTAGTLAFFTENGETLWADKTKTSYSLIKETSDIIDEPTPIEMMKAVKNETEIAATEHAHLKDGIAVTKFIYWLKQQMGMLAESQATSVMSETCGTGAGTTDIADITVNAAPAADNSENTLTELKCCDKLESLRRAQDGCFDLSFPTIAGYMSNGAIIHYEPTPETDAKIEANGVLLVDSGGQYMDGTTDITRTIAVGPLSDKIRKYYTLVLKGHIDLAMARFPRGTTGKELDAAARRPIQDAGLDYNHGTGHGVGHVLSVHEGPNYICKRDGDGDTEIIPGMITSDEPGLYPEGEFGIRIESEILCVVASNYPDAIYQDLIDLKEAADTDRTCGTDAGARYNEDMFGFKVITLAPLERDAIIPEMLTEKELHWLNSYHERVYSSVSPYLTAEEAAWLREVTLPL